MTITNPQGENLEYLIAGNQQAKEGIIFVHGFGVDLHETGGLFDFQSNALGDKYLTLQFSLSGCGQSGGVSEKMDYRKHAGDLNSVINFVRQNYPHLRLNLITHSMGGFVAATLSPDNISKTIMVGLPNYDNKIIENRILSRFKTRAGAELNLDGISLLPRSSGKIQKIGPTFWQGLRDIKPLELVETLSHKTHLKIIHMRQDEILGDEAIVKYHQLSNVQSAWINGNHSITDLTNRQELISEITNFLNS